MQRAFQHPYPAHPERVYFDDGWYFLTCYRPRLGLWAAYAKRSPFHAPHPVLETERLAIELGRSEEEALVKVKAALALRNN
jgi:hypothetical protein